MTNQPIAHLIGRVSMSESVSTLVCAPSGELVVGDLSGAVSFIDPVNSAVLSSEHRHDLGVLAMAVSADGAIATGGADGAVVVDSDTRHLVRGSEWANAIAWSREGDRLAAGIGHEVVVVDTNGSELLRADTGSTVTDVVWGSAELGVGAAGYGGIRWYRGSDPIPERRYEWKGSVLRVRASPSGRWIAAGCQDATVHLWRTPEGDDLECSGYPTKVDAIAWRSDGRELAVGCRSEVTLWDFSTRKGPRGMAPDTALFEDNVTALVAPQTGRSYLVGTANGHISALARTPRGKLARPILIAEVSASISAIAFDAEASRVHVGCVDGSVTTYDVRS